ncbi:glycosyl hydrolase [Streptomyces sp. NPDC048270]|uniref:glycoside hydrolase family 26 protein n=1 Tax=Streptomyces sp. NPDC048270 TaxID=3154615 RepID=UPI0033FC11FB
MKRFGGAVRRSRYRARRLVLGLVTVFVTSACTPWGLGFQEGGGPPRGASATAADYRPPDLRQLIRPPSGKYLGAAVDGAPTSMGPLKEYARTSGKQPNLVEDYAAWGDGFNASGVRNAWAEGALTLVSWEPRGITMKEITAGVSDDYVKEYALAVRRLNLPVVIDFADEMNGDWEDWGPEHTTAEDYAAAYRHVHDVFTDNLVANVIWAWAPNIVNPMPDVALAPYYPGDGYVDWIGMVGYFTRYEGTFDTVFGRTLTELRAIADKPLLIVETAAEPTARRAADVRELFAGVNGDEDIIGFVWFNHAKRADWRLETGTTAAMKQFRRLAADPRYGFDVRTRVS